jgi:hypothetical protein
MRHGYALGRIDQEVVASAVLRIALACTLLTKKSGVSVVQRQEYFVLYFRLMDTHLTDGSVL